jgi:hypothetical protein
MKTIFRQFAALAISAGLVCPTFAGNPGDPGPLDPATILNSPAPEAGEVLAFDMNRIVTQQLRIVRYQATEYQRKVAEQRARAYVAAKRRAIAQAKSSPKKTTTPKTTKSTTPPKSNKKTAKTTTPEPQDEPAPEPKKVARNIGVDPKPLPRYIAVDTVKDKRASPKAKKVVMVWDTHAENFVGNNIYDVENPPALGSTAKFETYAAEYIGTGL